MNGCQAFHAILRLYDKQKEHIKQRQLNKKGKTAGAKQRLDGRSNQQDQTCRKKLEGKEMRSAVNKQHECPKAIHQRCQHNSAALLDANDDVNACHAPTQKA